MNTKIEKIENGGHKVIASPQVKESKIVKKTIKQEALEVVDTFAKSKKQWCMLLEIYKENPNKKYGLYYNRCISSAFDELGVRHEVVTAAEARKRGFEIPSTVKGQAKVIIKTTFEKAKKLLPLYLEN